MKLWWLWHNFSNMFLHLNYNFFTLLQQTLYLGCLGCGNTAQCLLLTQINTNIVARSVLVIFIFYLSWNFIYVRWAGSSHSLDGLVFTVWLTQFIHVCCCWHFQYGCLDPPAWLVQSSVKKSFWVPLGLKISASWSMLHTLGKCRNCDLMWFVYLLVCRNSYILAYVYFRLIKVNFPFKGGG